jgi:hypothetical protein
MEFRAKYAAGEPAIHSSLIDAPEPPAGSYSPHASRGTTHVAGPSSDSRFPTHESRRSQKTLPRQNSAKPSKTNLTYERLAQKLRETLVSLFDSKNWCTRKLGKNTQSRPHKKTKDAKAPRIPRARPKECCDTVHARRNHPKSLPIQEMASIDNGVNPAS